MIFDDPTKQIIEMKTEIPPFGAIRTRVIILDGDEVADHITLSIRFTFPARPFADAINWAIQEVAYEYRRG